MNGVGVSEILPWVSFLLGLAVTALQIYVTGRLAKIKEDILTIIRHEIKEEVDRLESRMITKEVLELTIRNVELMLKHIQDRNR